MVLHTVVELRVRDAFGVFATLANRSVTYTGLLEHIFEEAQKFRSPRILFTKSCHFSLDFKWLDFCEFLSYEANKNSGGSSRFEFFKFFEKIC